MYICIHWYPTGTTSHHLQPKRLNTEHQQRDQHSTNDNTPHPTPPCPVAEHDTTWSSAAEHQQRDQHSTKDNTPHPTPPSTPPCLVAEHDTTGSSAAGQQPVCGHRRTWVPEGIYIYIYVYIHTYLDSSLMFGRFLRSSAPIIIWCRYEGSMVGCTVAAR